MIKLGFVLLGLLAGGLSSGALAADLMTPPEAPQAPATSSPWAGPYGGASVGYGPGTLSQDDCNDGYGFCSIGFSGLFIGGQAGFNFVLNDHWVVGIEGDINWTDESGSVTEYEAVPGVTGTATAHLDWTAAVTGHVGYATKDYFLYLLAGPAWAYGREDFAMPGGDSDPFDGSGSGTNTGWTVGAGIARMLTHNISGFVEARYSQYGSTPWNFTNTVDDAGADSLSIALQDTTIKGGLNFYFN